MRSSIVRGVAAALIGCGIGGASLIVGSPSAQAANCPPASVGGAEVGQITVSGASVPIKKVSFVPGGELNPPATNQAAGVSTLNAPLTATQGTTVLTWHARYGKGCPGTLNALLTMPVGSTFSVQPKGEDVREYQITRRLEVPKGRYKAAWFSPDGPHRLALFTCGDLRNGTFHSTIAVFAEPVATQSGAPTPGSSPSAEG